MSDSAFAFALGIGTTNANAAWLEVYFPEPLLHPPATLAHAAGSVLGGLEPDLAQQPLDTQTTEALAVALREAGELSQARLLERLAASGRPLAAVLLTDNRPPASVPEAYLKLHLLSHRLCRPHETDLSGLFAVLPNVAWTNMGAIDLRELPQQQLAARLRGDVLSVDSIDKFPRMTDYVVPSGVRIADGARVRLGAYLGEGTTVMHEGFINFNAGTEGPGMIEGRISAGVMVGSGSDLGGGCSTMGTLSGGGGIVISVGRDCLIGANAGIGIPLGDRCKVEAGLYVTAGTRVTVLDDAGAAVRDVKARELAGHNDLLFRRNSRTGAVECLTHRSAVALNAALHQHN
jgi:2,3,4,5-tetrahydropyridine-2,6-dicarboxylate N-succinyltransferase